MTPQTTPATQYYPLKNNPPLVELCKLHRKGGMTFEYFRDVHAKGACDQLTAEDLILLEQSTRP